MGCGWEGRVREALNGIVRDPLSLTSGVWVPFFLASEKGEKLAMDSIAITLPLFRSHLEEILWGGDLEESRTILEFAAGCVRMGGREPLPPVPSPGGFSESLLLEGMRKTLSGEPEWEGLPDYLKVLLALALVEILNGGMCPDLMAREILYDTLKKVFPQPEAEELLERIPWGEIRLAWEREQEKELRTMGGRNFSITALLWGILQSLPSGRELDTWLQERRRVFLSFLREVRSIRFWFFGAIGFFSNWEELEAQRRVEEFLRILREGKSSLRHRAPELEALRRYALEAAERLEKDPAAELPEASPLVSRALEYAFSLKEPWKHYPPARTSSFWLSLARMIPEGEEEEP